MSLADIYSKGVVTQKCVLSITEIGKNLKQILENKLKYKLEGKCCKDGFVRPDSVQIISYSSGKVFEGSKVEFEVVIEAQFAFPVEGMLIDAIANNITKAGIKATIPDMDPSPIILFISRDHFSMDDYFRNVKEGEKIVVRVIGQRFELNDPFISVIGELVKPRTAQGVGPRIQTAVGNEQGDKQQPYVVLE